jgi:hypothetical protein
VERSVHARATRATAYKVGEKELVVPPSDRLALAWLEAHGGEAWRRSRQAGSVRVTHTIAMTREQLLGLATKGNVPRATVVESTQQLLTKPNDSK